MTSLPVMYLRKPTVRCFPGSCCLFSFVSFDLWMRGETSSGNLLCPVTLDVTIFACMERCDAQSTLSGNLAVDGLEPATFGTQFHFLNRKVTAGVRESRARKSSADHVGSVTEVTANSESDWLTLVC